MFPCKLSFISISVSFISDWMFFTLLKFSILFFKLFSFSFVFNFYLFLKSRGETKRVRETSVCEKHLLVASHTPLTRDLAHNPGICSGWKLNLQPFGLQANASQGSLSILITGVLNSASDRLHISTLFHSFSGVLICSFIWGISFWRHFGSLPVFVSVYQVELL